VNGQIYRIDSPRRILTNNLPHKSVSTEWIYLFFTWKILTPLLKLLFRGTLVVVAV
jgi:hypothetical protein